MTGSTPHYGLPYPDDGDQLQVAVSTIPQQLAEAVESSLLGFGGIAAPGSWVDASLMVGTPIGAGYRGPQYRKVGSAVRVRGAIGGLGGGLTAGTDAFQLPVGFRPLLSETFRVSANLAGADIDVHIDVLSDGHVRIQSAIPVNGVVSFSGIDFDID